MRKIPANDFGYLVLDGYSELTRPTKRHKFRLVVWWSRIDQRSNQITDEEALERTDETIWGEAVSTAQKGIKPSYSTDYGFCKPVKGE